MSYEAKVFRVLIASPSDVAEEREIAVKTIQEWNDLNSSERQIVLLPLRWETHTAPEYGKRPQEVINRQMVDHCDLLIGVFWTRIGSPTGVADSGTLEEIERVASRGKPVMLYFSQAKKDPDEIQLDQLQALRDFKKKTFPKALVENYSSQIEFRDKLAKQIEIQLRTLIVKENDGEKLGSTASEISLEFSEPNNVQPLGDEINLEFTYIDVIDIEEIPDYTVSSLPVNESAKSKKISLVKTNRDFYRDYVNYLVKESMHRPIRFWLKNQGYIGARDIFLDLRVTSNINSLTIQDSDDFDNEKPSRDSDEGFNAMRMRRIVRFGIGDDIQISRKADHWSGSIELRALQPKREISPRDRLVIGCEESGKIQVEALIYADTLAEPIKKILNINVAVERVEVTYEELLSQNGISLADELKISA